MKMTEYQRRLVEEHMGLVSMVIRGKIGVTNGTMMSFDDLFQVGSEALCKAALSYQPQRGQFEPFACKVVYHALISYCRQVTRQKDREMEILFDEDNSQMALQMNYGKSESVYKHIEREEAMNIFRKRKEEATKGIRKGMEIIELQMNGYSVSEIAEKYQTTTQNVYVWLSRARKKLQGDREMLEVLC